ncbi:hypothetical protein ONS95_012807 [Cadophora gregata]|uniref:uncharacterized protein n=1 Tax=Cadophora gregata TaxID=51156 RepID=UPI0026DD8F81|nr:uncharacterized protein ONS95_012807 [Cadophora gregata]KAK0101211.1 hypothetical protein ONS96_006433 [Cadophora gregata f. sp. sojae]KAK0115754.1 hypothetical protein ONS95_012807 [Cadophora gregata]
MAPSLEALSEELLVRIISLTPRHALHAVALTSRTLNRLATPALYSNIDLEGSNGASGTKFLIPLTYHLLKNTSLAAMVQTFAMRDMFSSEDEGDLVPLCEGRDSNSRKGGPDDQMDVDSLLMKAVADVEDAKEEEKLFKIVLEGSDEGLIIALLISKLPNLRRLQIVGDMMDAQERILHFIQRISRRDTPFDKKPVLTKLTDVLISGWDEKYPNPPDMIGAYMELPSIRRVHCYQLGNNEQDAVTESLGTLGIATSPVEELELRGSQLYAADLDKILKSCRNLKTFIYEVGHAWAWYTVRTSDIMDSMKAVEKTLENLVLDHSEYIGDAAEDIDHLSALSLAAFDKLRYLKISAMFLGGFKKEVKYDLGRTFPASLEELHVTYVGDQTYCPSWIPAALQDVIERKETVFPAMMKLTLQGAFLTNADRLDAIKALVQTARKKGVEIVILAEDGDTTDAWDRVHERGYGLHGEIEWSGYRSDMIPDLVVVDVEGRGW